MNVAIVLAAGNSTRFSGEPKQLYNLNGKPMVCHSVEMLCDVVDEVIVVTNSTCYRKIKKIFKKFNVDVVKNDIDTRIASIKAGIDHIEQASNVIIHDAARPFVTQNHVCTLLDCSAKYICAQYYFKLVNGLVKCTEDSVEVVPREQHFELVTPQIIDYRLARDLYANCIDLANPEVLPVLHDLHIKCKLIEGFQKHLRKITTLEDLY